MINRYAGTCSGCGKAVPAGEGEAYKAAGRWRVRHTDCAAAGSSRETRVHTYATSSGWTGTRNARGRCEDAPCCGCCTF